MLYSLEIPVSCQPAVAEQVRDRFMKRAGQRLATGPEKRVDLFGKLIEGPRFVPRPLIDQQVVVQYVDDDP